MKYKFLASIMLIMGVMLNLEVKAQLSTMDSLRLAIRQLELQTQQIDLRMSNSHRQFQSGILVSTVGYSVTIAGGLMLGRSNDRLGQGLLVAGGLTGAAGTFLLTDAFRILGGKSRKGRKP